jgi:hypothetical protein
LGASITARVVATAFTRKADQTKGPLWTGALGFKLGEDDFLTVSNIQLWQGKDGPYLQGPPDVRRVYEDGEVSWVPNLNNSGYPWPVCRFGDYLQTVGIAAISELLQEQAESTGGDAGDGDIE